MKKFFFLMFIFVQSHFFCCECHRQTQAGFPLNVVTANNLTFFTDPEKIVLESGLAAVFPYADEATLLLDLATKIKCARGRPFDLAVDPFCGDGKSGLPLLHHDVAQKLAASDINPRAIQYAVINSYLNHLDGRVQFSVRDIKKVGLVSSDAPGNTLWIANPPFSLSVKGANMEIMRDGGENGLSLTLAFVKSALEQAKPGDVILGLGYSRITKEGKLELEDALAQLGCNATLTLLCDQKLWRDFQGKKEQSNPMEISGDTFALKANPFHPDEIEAYRKGAENHVKAGYTKLGYFSYCIRK